MPDLVKLREFVVYGQETVVHFLNQCHCKHDGAGVLYVDVDRCVTVDDAFMIVVQRVNQPRFVQFETPIGVQEFELYDLIDDFEGAVRRATDGDIDHTLEL